MAKIRAAQWRYSQQAIADHKQAQAMGMSDSEFAKYKKAVAEAERRNSAKLAGCLVGNGQAGALQEVVAIRLFSPEKKADKK
jgi:hypothetical protein